MPITDLIYKCPFCNSKILGLGPNKASCLGCEIRFSRSEGAQILVESKENQAYLTSGDLLKTAIETSVTDRTESFNGEGNILSSDSVVYRMEGCQPVYSSGVLMGYTENMLEQESGLLNLGERLVFTVGDGTFYSWGLEEISSFLISSKAIQVYIRKQGLFQFKLTSDSPKEWEDTLTASVNKFHRLRGNEVLAYHPVIKTRKLKQ